MRVSADTKRQTRERILAAAGSLFASKGYGNTTTRDVAGEAGIATGTLFNYFPNKESLAMTLLASALGEARELWRSRRRGNESLDEDLFSHVATALRALAPHRLYVGEVFETAMSPFARSQVCREGDEVRVSHLEQVAAILGDHGRRLNGPSEVISIHLYWTLFLGVLAFWSSDASDKQGDSLAVLDQSLRLFVNSLDTPELAPIKGSGAGDASSAPVPSDD
jgi:AcrR family transcriptional regulator